MYGIVPSDRVTDMFFRDSGELASSENKSNARRYAEPSLASVCMTFHVFPDFLQSFDIMNFGHARQFASSPNKARNRVQNNLSL